MRKLSKLKLKEFQEMSRFEMRMSWEDIQNLLGATKESICFIVLLILLVPYTEIRKQQSTWVLYVQEIGRRRPKS